MTLIAVAGLALAAGGCSLRSPAGSSTYSSLQPNVAVAAIPSPNTAALPAGFEAAPAPALMPGDPTRPIPEANGGRVDPLAALTQSERARDHWETLKPDDRKAHAPAIARAFAGTVKPGTDKASTPAAASNASSSADTETYDREVAMQTLINGGKSAGKHICNGC